MLFKNKDKDVKDVKVMIEDKQKKIKDLKKELQEKKKLKSLSDEEKRLEAELKSLDREKKSLFKDDSGFFSNIGRVFGAGGEGSEFEKSSFGRDELSPSGKKGEDNKKF